MEESVSSFTEREKMPRQRRKKQLYIMEQKGRKDSTKRNWKLIYERRGWEILNKRIIYSLDGRDR